MKTMLYYTDLAPLLAKEDKALDKLERVLKVFFENKDNIHLIWHPYIRMKEFLELNNFRYMDRYYKIIEDYKAQGWGEFDQETDPYKLAERCDAYYGDYSDIVFYMRQADKPSMIQNVDL